MGIFERIKLAWNRGVEQRRVAKENRRGLQTIGEAGILHKPSEEYLKDPEAMRQLRAFNEYFQENKDEDGVLTLNV